MGEHLLGGGKEFNLAAIRAVTDGPWRIAVRRERARNAKLKSVLTIWDLRKCYEHVEH